MRARFEPGPRRSCEATCPRASPGSTALEAPAPLPYPGREVDMRDFGRAVGLLVIGFLAGCSHAGAPPQQPAQAAMPAPAMQPVQPQPAEPPLVLMGESELTCNIDRA